MTDHWIGTMEISEGLDHGNKHTMPKWRNVIFLYTKCFFEIRGFPVSKFLLRPSGVTSCNVAIKHAIRTKCFQWLDFHSKSLRQVLVSLSKLISNSCKRNPAPEMFEWQQAIQSIIHINPNILGFLSTFRFNTPSPHLTWHCASAPDLSKKKQPCWLPCVWRVGSWGWNNDRSEFCREIVGKPPNLQTKMAGNYRAQTRARKAFARAVGWFNRAPPQSPPLTSWEGILNIGRSFVWSTRWYGASKWPPLNNPFATNYIHLWGQLLTIE